MIGSVQNRLLRALSSEDLGRLWPSMEARSVAAGETLYEAYGPVDEVLFVESGLLSCFAGQGGRDRTEVAIIGREGMSGLFTLLGAQGFPFHVVAQKAGEVYGISALRLQQACSESASLFDVMLRYTYALSIQIAETGRANARQTVETRLARWLLMARDRIDGNEIELTHETLSTILGVRRPGITVALHVLEGEHMIRARRGVIEILDRSKLEVAANGSYGLSEQEYERVLGSPAAIRLAGP